MSQCYSEKRKIKLKIIERKGDCPYFQRVGEEYELDKILPHNLCLVALHTVFPYYLTLLYGGWFKWMHDHHAVIVQCPNPANYVIMEIRRQEIENERKIFVKIIGKNGNCQKGYKIGDCFKIDLQSSLNFCFRAFDVIYPHCFSVMLKDADVDNNQNLTPLLIGCPSRDNTVVFNISSKKIE